MQLNTNKKDYETKNLTSRSYKIKSKTEKNIEIQLNTIKKKRRRRLLPLMKYNFI